MKPKTLIHIFIVIVIIYFLYNYFFYKNSNNKEPFISASKSFVREKYRNTNKFVLDSFTSVKNGLFRQLRFLGIK